MMKGRKWQNLIDGKCPDCSENLDTKKDKTIICECLKCGFMISQRKYIEILTDENHIMRQFLAPHEKEKLIQLTKAVYDQV